MCASGHQRRRSDPKYREVIGVLVSRLQRNTRAADIERHVSCDHILSYLILSYY